MRKTFIILLFSLCTSIIFGQRLVTFYSVDGLDVTADYYETDAQTHNYLLLFHQAEYSRGEYVQIATRLIKLGFNCLAIDLRYGQEVNFINNETAMRARKKGFPVTMLDCEKDMIASISYIYSIDPNAKIYLLGSSFSASLCLKLAKERNDIVAVMGFSPGEFFGNDLSIEETIKGLSVPVFIGCPRSEYFYVTQLMSGVISKKKVVFKPEGSDGLHGAKTLWWESATRDEFWLSLLFFLKDFD